MQYQRRTDLLEDRVVWVISLENNFQNNTTLLISKVSEAILPETAHNHVGQGSTMDGFIQSQPGVRFVINGGFSHYRKDFYDWPHQDYNVGDPVGLVKIRHHYYEDLLDIEDYGFFVQDHKGAPWQIVRHTHLGKDEKYILGCTPLLIFDNTAIPLPIDKMQPMPSGKINPPSILAHGLARHPRTALGIKDSEIYFIIVEGSDSEGGCTLEELQNIGLRLGLQNFMNLDGGGSSQFRLFSGNGYIKNNVSADDEQRILGHVIALFDEELIKPPHLRHPKPPLA